MGRLCEGFSDAFFDHMNADNIQSTSGRSFQGLISSYSNLKQELKAHILKNNKTLDMGTSKWKEMETISAISDGRENADLVVNSSGKFFLGKN